MCNTITEAAEKLLMCTQAAPSDGSGIEFSMLNSLSSTHMGALVRLEWREGTGGDRRWGWCTAEQGRFV